MRDFTLKKYEQLVCALRKAGYAFLTFEQYCMADKAQLPERFVILRHDIDKRAWQAVKVAEIERQSGAHASYYFRVVPESNQPEVIRQIVAMGHEIGYHYEDMSRCQGDAKKAEAHFEQWLRYFRRFYPVRTICMHGAPQSGYDSKDLWRYCDYHDYGIMGEPYFDTDFSDVLYLTDTGRRWDGYMVSVRDRIPQYQEEWTARGLVYHTTDDIIRAAQTGTLPRRILMTTHPQRWTDKPLLWLYELLRQTLVNIVKRMIVK